MDFRRTDGYSGVRFSATGSAMLRKTYDRIIAMSDKPYAPYVMGTVSFAESSFFPIPPDVMLIPMSLAHPHRSYALAWLCTWTSVLGGILGYAIGALLYDSIGHWLIQLYGYGDKVEAFRAQYAQWGMWIILLKGITPIPYKIVTITSGFAGYNLLNFILFSIIARGFRFFLFAFVMRHYGERARAIIEERLALFFWGGLAVLIGGFVLVTFVF